MAQTENPMRHGPTETAPVPQCEPTENSIEASAEISLTPQKLGESFAKQVDPKPKSCDPFDLENLVVPQNFAETAGVRKLLTTIPCHKPSQQDFVRVHPDPDYRHTLTLIELKDDREMFLVDAPNARNLTGETCVRTLYWAINRQGVPFLWPVPVPDPNGRVMEWHRSMAEAAELAMTKWIRIKANMSLGAYDIFVAEGNLSEPEWPDLSYKEILRTAFRHKLVDSTDHAVIKRLRGLV